MPSHESVVWLNGSLVPNHKACVSPFDRGLTVGDGAFETLRAYEGAIFAITRHWLRLGRSCEVLGIEPPPRDVFTDAMQQTLSASGLRDARVRFTVTSGEAHAGARRADVGRTMFCFAMPAPVHAERSKVQTAPWPRNERSALVGVKSLSYGENVLALAHAREHRADEAVFANTQGELCEGAGSNVFLVQGGRLHTPPLSSGCLAGVTRGLVLELCRAHGIPASETPLPIQALAVADEAFLTSSTREVQAISHVDGRPIFHTVGPLTQRVAALYRNLVRENPDPPPGSLPGA